MYVREAPGGARALEAAPTAVALIIGEAERGPTVATSITSAVQYERLFGGYRRLSAGGSEPSRLFMPFAVRGFFDNGGPRAYILRLVAQGGGIAEIALNDGTDNAVIRATTPGANGDRLRIAIADATDADAAHFNLHVFQEAADTTISEVEFFENLSANSADPNFLVTRLEASSFIDWVGAPFRPNLTTNGPGDTPPGDPLTGGGVSTAPTTAFFDVTDGTLTARLSAGSTGAWGNSLSVSISDSADGDPERFDLRVFYQAPGETAASEVERFEGLTANPTMKNSWLISSRVLRSWHGRERLSGQTIPLTKCP